MSFLLLKIKENVVAKIGQLMRYLWYRCGDETVTISEIMWRGKFSCFLLVDFIILPKWLLVLLLEEDWPPFDIEQRSIVETIAV